MYEFVRDGEENARSGGGGQVGDRGDSKVRWG